MIFYTLGMVYSELVVIDKNNSTMKENSNGGFYARELVLSIQERGSLMT